jgi:hypothetical protein
VASDWTPASKIRPTDVLDHDLDAFLALSLRTDPAMSSLSVDRLVGAELLRVREFLRAARRSR